MTSEKSSSSNLLVPLLAGMAGVAAGLLLAPRSGRETRQQLRATAEEVKGKATESLDTARASVEEGLNRAKHAGGRVAEAIKIKGKNRYENNNTNTQDFGQSQTLTAWEEEV